jgi:hypothetical protein
MAGPAPRASPRWNICSAAISNADPFFSPPPFTKLLTILDNLEKLSLQSGVVNLKRYKKYLKRYL